MTLLTLSAFIFIIAVFAGILGALTGIGGGIVLIPALVLLFHVNLYYAMGAALLSVIATSSGAAIAYLNQGYTNFRIGIFLETAAVLGALIGAALILILNANIIAIVFGLILIFSAYLTVARKRDHAFASTSHPWAIKMKLNGAYPKNGAKTPYAVQGVPGAWAIMLVAGILSSLLGIGSGALKVLAMDQVMRLPYKVATATSNFIIGITAAVSVGIYFSRGYVDPVLSFPVVLGVLIGSILGGKIMQAVSAKKLRIIFTVVVLFLAIQMIMKGWAGSL